MACPSHSRPCAVWSSGFLWSALCGREQPLFMLARAGAVRLERACVEDHSVGFGCGALSGKRCEYSTKHVALAPAQRILKSLMWILDGNINMKY